VRETQDVGLIRNVIEIRSPDRQNRMTALFLGEKAILAGVEALRLDLDEG
jgi:hypothetical protein